MQQQVAMTLYYSNYYIAPVCKQDDDCSVHYISEEMISRFSLINGYGN